MLVIIKVKNIMIHYFFMTVKIVPAAVFIVTIIFGAAAIILKFI